MQNFETWRWNIWEIVMFNMKTMNIYYFFSLWIKLKAQHINFLLCLTIRSLWKTPLESHRQKLLADKRCRSYSYANDAPCTKTPLADDRANRRRTNATRSSRQQHWRRSSAPGNQCSRSRAYSATNSQIICVVPIKVLLLLLFFKKKTKKKTQRQ